jgi:hypothetical protein
MFKKIVSLMAVSTLFAGCASVPTESNEQAEAAKMFSTPATGKAGIYIFRNNSPLGAALKKDVWLNGKCIGETAPGIFFYEQIVGDLEHKLSTES